MTNHNSVLSESIKNQLANSIFEFKHGFAAKPVSIPKFGMGVWQVEDGPLVEESTLHALELGYRLIDTAAIYGNEKGVGRAIARSGIPRNQIFVTSKLWNEDIRQKREQTALQTSLEKLNLDYLDLYLVHWPIAGRIVEPWTELIKSLEKKLVRAIGVSNYHEAHLNEIISKTGITPSLNQIELHPLLQQKSLRNYCEQKGIAVQAWSPLMQGKFVDQPVLQKLATTHHCTIPQIILAWNLAEGILTIPKTIRAERLFENAHAFDIKLSGDDINTIRNLDSGHRFGPNPDSFNF